jgi:hypothetical protein
LVSEPEGKALLLEETFLPVPPHADLQDIQEATYADQFKLPAVPEQEVQRAIQEIRPDGIINRTLQLRNCALTG